MASAKKVVSTEYIVWICVERHETFEDGSDRYEDDDLAIGSQGAFDTYEEAEAVATQIHDAANAGNLYCQHGKPENPGPCPHCAVEAERRRVE